MVERPIISRVDTHNEEYESFAHLRGRKRKEESFVWVARMARRFDIRVEASCGAGKDSKEGRNGKGAKEFRAMGNAEGSRGTNL